MISEKENWDTVIQARITKEAYKECAEMARSQGCSISTWLRRLIIYELNRYKKESNVPAEARRRGVR